MGSLGLDISSKRLLAVVLGHDGRVTHKARYRMEQHCLPRSCASLMLRAIDDAQSSIGPVDGIGIGFPGVVDAKKGIARYSTILPGWENIRLANAIGSAAQLPCAIDNRVNNNARAELSLRHGQPDTFLFVSAGDQVRAALVLDGTVWTGTSGLAGELGHVCVQPDGPRCTCGSNGCINVLATTQSIASELNVAPRDVSVCVQTRPNAAETVLAAAGSALGRAIAAACNLMNVSMVVLAGPLAGFEPFRTAAELTARNIALDEVQAACTFEVARAGISGKALGAAVLAQTLPPRSLSERSAA